MHLTDIPCKAVEGIEAHKRGSAAATCEKCLEYLNACRTLVEIGYVWNAEVQDYILEKEHNQKSGTFAANHFVHEMNLQEHFVFLKRLEAITAEVSYLYSQKIIKERVTDPDVVRRKSSPAEFKKAVAESRMANRPAKEKRQLSEREKAIEGLMKGTGLDEKMATLLVDEQFKKQGKVVA